MKVQVGFNEDLSYLHPKDSGSNHAKILHQILNYKVHRGREDQGIYFEKVLHSLSKAENRTVVNPRFNDSSDEQPHLSDKMVALVHFGRSGTGLMHSLIDGHPEVSTLPSIYFSEYFDRSTWEKIISAGWDGMVDRFIEIYDVLFDATSSVPVTSRSTTLIYNIGVKEGMANLGAERNEVLGVDRKIFRSELTSLLNCYEEMDAFILFKLVHVAYDRAINDHNSKSLIFYHIHNPEVYAQLNFTRFNPDTNWVMMVREPIQSCESWIRQKLPKKNYFAVATVIIQMLFEIDNVVYRDKNCVGVRLEDLKKNKPRKTIPAICKWMGISENEQLYEMTAQGKKWWGDPTSLIIQKTV